jgi:hypothetical protein
LKRKSIKEFIIANNEELNQGNNFLKNAAGSSSESESDITRQIFMFANKNEEIKN